MVIALCIVAALLLLLLTVTFICFYITFYSKNNKKDEGFSLPPGPVYEPYRDIMYQWANEVKALPHEDVEITSFDGLTLRGRIYEYAPGADIELMLPGYRGNAERDLCGGVQRCFSLGRSALIVDQRGCGRSDGHVISFGVNEHKDCLRWLDYLVERYGYTRRIILTGISMGASTVLITSGKQLPKNVIGVIADCGFTSPKEIIQKVIKDMKLPSKLLYPFVRLAGILYGGFDIESCSSIEAMENCSIPVFFAHGDNDDYVPCSMSQRNYDACKTPKFLLRTPGAGHGLAYVVDPDGYINALENMKKYYSKMCCGHKRHWFQQDANFL